MSKKFLLIMFLTLSLLLSACSFASLPSLPEITPKVTDTLNINDELNSHDDQNETIVEESSSNIIDYEIKDEADCFNVYIKVENKSPIIEYAPDGSENIVLSYICELPVFTSSGNAAGVSKINDFFSLMNDQYYTGEALSVIDKHWPGFNSLLEQSYSNYQSYIDYKLSDVRLDFCFSHKIEPIRVDSKIISVLVHDYMYNGSNKEVSFKYGLSFSSVTGELITCDTFTLYQDCIIDSINNNYNIMYSFDDLFKEGKWYLSDDSICFINDFTDNEGAENDVYKVAYKEINLNNEDIIINKKSKVLFDDISVYSLNENNYPVIDLAVYENADNNYFVYFPGTAYDICVSNVQYSDFDSRFYIKSYYWYSNYISESLIQLNIDVPEGMPSVLITYTDNDEKHDVYLSFDDEVNKPIFVENAFPLG